MVDTKKEQERDELHRAIWAIADGILKIMFLEQCFTVIFQKICAAM